MQKASGDHTHAGVPFVLGAKAALHDVLAGAVVPDADAEKAGEDAGEREHLVLDAVEDLEFFGILMDQVKQSAYFPQSDYGHQDAAD